MQTHKLVEEKDFLPINRGFNSTFRPNRLSLGLVIPLETYAKGPVPVMARHVERVYWLKNWVFSAIWLRDVPLNVPSFGDAGQMFDPFVYLGLLAAQTERIALGVASIVLPLSHPAHSAQTIADIYKQRWQVELFFKWIKQNLKIKTFLGHSKNAVMTQIN